MKSFKIGICLLLVCLLFAGCESSQSLSDLTIVQGVGIDLQQKDIKVSLQYLNLAQSGGSTDSLSGNITSNADGTADCISDAISSASKTLSQEIFFGQNKIVVFGSDYAQSSVEKGMDYLIRSVDSRPDVLVAISDGTAEEIINSKEKDARIPAENVYNLLRVGEKNGLGAVVTVNDLLNLYSDETSDIYLPVLKSDNDKVRCEGIAIFSKEQYQIILNGNQTFGFLFVNNKIDGGSLIVRNEELGIVGVEIVNSKTKNSVSVKNGKPVFNCNIKINFMLDEVEKGITTTVNDKRIKTIESMVNKRVKEMCMSAVTTCFVNKSDPFMIGRYTAKADNEYYDSVKKNWRNNLENIEINIKVSSDLQKVNDNSIRE